MRHITLTYRLANGHRGQLSLIARSTACAIIQACEMFGDALRGCSAKVAA